MQQRVITIAEPTSRGLPTRAVPGGGRHVHREQLPRGLELERALGRNQRSSHVRGRRGLTMVEMLVSLTITALLITAVVSTTRALGQARAKVDLRVARVTEGRRALETIVAALRNVRRDPIERQPVIVGQRQASNPLGGPNDRIDLLIISDQPARPEGAESDQYEMSFQLMEMPGRLPVLACRKDHALDEQPTDGGLVTVVAENILGLAFEYLSGDEWLTEWDPLSPTPPQAVRVTVYAAAIDAGTPAGRPQVTMLSSVVPIRVTQPAGQQEQQEGQAPPGGPPA